MTVAALVRPLTTGAVVKPRLSHIEESNVMWKMIVAEYAKKLSINNWHPSNGPKLWLHSSSTALVFERDSVKLTLPILEVIEIVYIDPHFLDKLDFIINTVEECTKPKHNTINYLANDQRIMLEAFKSMCVGSILSTE